MAGLRVTGLLFYIALAIPIAMVYVGRLPRLGEKAIPSFLAFLATGLIGVLFYNPASLGACASLWKSLSLVTTFCFTSLSYLFGGGSAGRSAQRHSFAAYGVGLAGAGETALDQSREGWLKATPLCFEIVLSLLQRQTGHRSSCCGVIANHA